MAARQNRHGDIRCGWHRGGLGRVGRRCWAARRGVLPATPAPQPALGLTEVELPPAPPARVPSIRYRSGPGPTMWGCHARPAGHTPALVRAEPAHWTILADPQSTNASEPLRGPCLRGLSWPSCPIHNRRTQLRAGRTTRGFGELVRNKRFCVIASGNGSRAVRARPSGAAEARHLG
jgi:hypothetical protein